jgi:hypothetical protein
MCESRSTEKKHGWRAITTWWASDEKMLTSTSNSIQQASHRLLEFICVKDGYHPMPYSRVNLLLHMPTFGVGFKEFIFPLMLFLLCQTTTTTLPTPVGS